MSQNDLQAAFSFAFYFKHKQKHYKIKNHKSLDICNKRIFMSRSYVKESEGKYKKSDENKKLKKMQIEVSGTRSAKHRDFEIVPKCHIVNPTLVVWLHISWMKFLYIK